MPKRPWEKIGEGVWLKSFPLSLLGTRIGRTVTAFQLDSGDAIVHSTAPFLEDDVLFLRQLGNRLHILEATCFHDTFTQQAIKAIPEALIYIPESFPLKEGIFKSIDELAKITDGILEMIPVGGMPKVNETAVYDPGNRLLVISDLLFNFGSDTDKWTLLFFRLAAGIKAYPGMSRLFRMMIRDRLAFQASIDRLRALDYDKLVLAHGEVITSGAKNAFDKALNQHGY